MQLLKSLKGVWHSDSGHRVVADLVVLEAVGKRCSPGWRSGARAPVDEHALCAAHSEDDFVTTNDRRRGF